LDPNHSRRSEKGYDILVEVDAVHGWNESTYRERPASDAKPILLPWKQASAVYYFDGDLAFGGEPRMER